MVLHSQATALKVIWLTHFVLSSWALLSGFALITTYLYTHVALLACGLWAIVAVESTDAIIMFLATLAVSILNDILILSLYEPRLYGKYEHGDIDTSQRNEYRFALGMCITNLILKPLSVIVLFYVHKSRVNGSEFSIPGLDSSRFGSNFSGYNNIESSPGHTSIHVRTSDPPLYQPPAYQEPPPMGPVDQGKS